MLSRALRSLLDRQTGRLECDSRYEVAIQKDGYVAEPTSSKWEFSSCHRTRGGAGADEARIVP